MPKNYGSYIDLDISSVRDKAAKTITYLESKLPSLASHTLNVIFLGEEHRNAIDSEVTTHILSNPPVLANNHTRVIFERGLSYPIATGMDERTEQGTMELNHAARSKKIADMIQDAFSDDHEKTLVYVACGINHAVEVFDALNKTLKTNFGFIVKPSSTD